MSDITRPRRKPRYRATHCPFYNPKSEPNPETPQEMEAREKRDIYRTTKFFGTILTVTMGAAIGITYLGPDAGFFLGGGLGLLASIIFFRIYKVKI